jgi:hypothetical protein
MPMSLTEPIPHNTTHSPPSSCPGRRGICGSVAQHPRLGQGRAMRAGESMVDKQRGIAWR